MKATDLAVHPDHKGPPYLLKTKMRVDEMKTSDLEASTFQDKPAYRYIRKSDKLPTGAAGPPVARIKLFDPCGSWTWYIDSYDPQTRTAYGLVDGFEKEYGYIDMAELVALRNRFGLPIERDLYWRPTALDSLAESEEG